MPTYARSRHYKPRKTYGRRRKSRVTRGQAYGKVANDALKLAKWTASMLNVEHKRVDSSLIANITNTAVPQLVNPLALGNTFTTRNGNSVKYTSVYCKGTLSWNPLAGATSVQNIRLIWLLDKTPKGVIAQMTDQYVTGDVYSLIAPDQNPGRFKILKDHRFMLNAQRPQVNYSFFSKMPFHTDYGLGNTGTVADISRNSLVLITVSDQATANYPGAALQIRVKYIDN